MKSFSITGSRLFFEIMIFLRRMEKHGRVLKGPHIFWGNWHGN